MILIYTFLVLYVSSFDLDLHNSTYVLCIAYIGACLIQFIDYSLNVERQTVIIIHISFIFIIFYKASCASIINIDEYKTLPWSNFRITKTTKNKL